ncbi:Exportin-2-like [Oopsacas minuta]|uniref:Exportin-2-like n=1 Tax=Oopsacas minuta TaxID=111878 RepID=A0AAV7KDW6_9METZ|nr:Exportin-2-like [Oopsacas minuta]
MAEPFDQPTVRLIKSQRGGDKLFESGSFFGVQRRVADVTYWLCEQRGVCKARVHTKGMVIVKRTNEHSHGPDDVILQTIKQHVVSVMLVSPDIVQKQISDAISIIGKRDFPKDWSGLLGELTSKLQSGDFHAINGALQTAHSLFKKYRYEIKNQTLWEEIKFVLENFADPFTNLFVTTIELCQTHKEDIKVISILYESVLLCTKIFHSLNYQELPDHFEENMQVWMEIFHQLLQLENQLVETDIDTEVGVLQLIKSQVCDNVALYAQKFDEDFKDYLPRFVEDIWTLLVSTGLKAKYDILMCNAIDFLARVAEKNTYKSLFEGEGILLTICSQVTVITLLGLLLNLEEGKG